MIREYLMISRLFNMGLTGVAPVLGAFAMWNNENTTVLHYFILFSIGCFSHVYGFVLNDIVDTKVDKLSKELFSRPLVSESISRKKAAYFAVICMISSFIFSIYFFNNNITVFIIQISILLFAYILATIYNFGSKRYPGMDIFVAGAVFFLIIYGAATISIDRLFSEPLIWIVALIGGLQVIFMNMINGAIKDIDHDEKGFANTIAIKLGAKTHKGIIMLPRAFRIVGYSVELLRSFLIFLPFLYIPKFNQSIDIFLIIRIAFLVFLTLITFYFIHRLFSIKKFERDEIRKTIGVIVIVMYATAPVMLSTLNITFFIIAFVPPFWFVLSNLILHGTLLSPKTM